MIRYASEAIIWRGDMYGFPSGVKKGDDFWCSFNTRKQLIMCNVQYLGTDTIMKPNIWYNVIIELAYGELFPPIGNKMKESIELAKEYNLNCASEIVGKVILKKIEKISLGKK